MRGYALTVALAAIFAAAFAGPVITTALVDLTAASNAVSHALHR